LRCTDEEHKSNAADRLIPDGRGSAVTGILALSATGLATLATLVQEKMAMVTPAAEEERSTIAGCLGCLARGS